MINEEENIVFPDFELSEEELNEYVREISPTDDNSIIAEDSDLQDAEEESAKEIHEIESLDIKDEEDDNILDVEKLSDKAWGYDVNLQYNKEKATYEKIDMKPAFIEDIRVAKHVFNEGKKITRMEIQRDAFSQDIIDLNSFIPRKHLQLLIEILTRGYVKGMERNIRFVNKRIAYLMFPYVPKCLKIAYKYFNSSIKMCPGFLYRASEEYGKSKTIWVTPIVPYFLEQGTEMDFLLERRFTYLKAIDRSVAAYWYYRDKLAMKEANYAAKLVRNLRKGTYLELLKYNPYWYHKLFVELKAIDDENKNRKTALQNTHFSAK